LAELEKRTASVDIGLSAFRGAGVLPLNHDAIPEHFFSGGCAEVEVQLQDAGGYEAHTESRLSQLLDLQQQIMTTVQPLQTAEFKHRLQSAASRQSDV
jgi:hypothetical protein